MLAWGLFESDVGVLFRIPSEGDNILCVTRWSSHPTEATIPVGRPAEVIYLLLANITQNSQTHLAQARVHIEYADGREERIDLRAPGRSTTCSNTTRRRTTPSGWAESSEATTGMAAHPARMPISWTSARATASRLPACA